MAFPNPIGYWVSARSEHPAAPVLNELESLFGSYFQTLSKNEVLCLLVHCAAKCQKNVYVDMARELTENELTAINLIDKLSPDYSLGLVPFLYEQTSRYSSQKTADSK